MTARATRRGEEWIRLIERQRSGAEGGRARARDGTDVDMVTRAVGRCGDGGYTRDRSLCVTFAACVAAWPVVARRASDDGVRLYFRAMRGVGAGRSRAARGGRVVRGAGAAGVRRGGREETVRGEEERPRAGGRRAGVDGETRGTFARGGGRDVVRQLRFSGIVVPSCREAFLLFTHRSRRVEVVHIAAIAQKGGDGLQAVMERDGRDC